MAYILVVDDEITHCDALAYFLERQGYCVERSYNGETALEKVEQVEFRIVLSDIEMPGLGGLELARRVKILRPQTEIFLMSTSLAPDRLAGLEGVRGVFEKPLHFNAVKRAIEKLLGKERGNSA